MKASNCLILKCVNDSVMFIPEWESIIGDIVIHNKDLFNVRLFKERECCRKNSYLEIKKFGYGDSRTDWHL